MSPADTQPTKAFDARAFRSALGAFPTGVTIVTTRAPDGSPVGVTANSFNSVSLDPPMILWSLAKSSRSLPAFAAATYWTVHILAADQESLSNRFARSGEDKFTGLVTESGADGVPLLTGCACRLQCKTAFRYEGGDHIILVGEVVEFEHRDVASLVFHAGKYALAAHKAAPELLSGGEPRDLDISTGEDFLGYLLWRAHLHFQGRVMTHLEAQGLDVDAFMVLAMLLHRDGRRLSQIEPSLLQSGKNGVALHATALAARGLVRTEGANENTRLWLTEEGRRVTLHIHAASKSLETQLLGRLAASEAIAFKHLLRQFIAATDSGQAHPWQVAPRA